MNDPKNEADGLPPPRKTAKFRPSDPKPEYPAKPIAGFRPSDDRGDGPDDDAGGDPEFDNLVGALRRNRRRLLRLPGVTAVDVGFKIVDGSFTEELALRVHVERKLPDHILKKRPSEVVSTRKDSKLKEPEQKYYGPLSDLPVTIDVIEAEYRPAASNLPPPRPATVVQTPVGREIIDRRRRIDPLIGGISIGSAQASFGTLGALVWDNTDGSVCILSNWHVLAGHPHAEPGNPCLQPGPFDRGRPSDIVARLKRWSFDSQTDAAIAELTGNRHYCAGEILGLPPTSGAIDPHLGMRLLKSGRSTRKNGGFVDGLHFSSAIEYSTGVVQIFEDQIHIAPLNPDERISELGDSGAVWVSKDTGEAVGLHFAGDFLRSVFGEYALANPITLVLDRLNFSFRPVFLEIRDEDVNSLPPTRIEFGNGERPLGRGERHTGSGPQGDQVRIPPGGQ